MRCLRPCPSAHPTLTCPPTVGYKLSVHALPYTLGVFALILVLTRLKVPLSAAIALGAVVCGAAFGLGADEIALTARDGAVQARTIALMITVVLLLGLSAIMRQSGQLDRIVALARAVLRRPTVTMAALPALIGLLPMPGGALVSAPMVASAAGQTGVRGERLSGINYWFRHIWEHWWPLYPGVMLATDFIAGASAPAAAAGGLGTFALHQFPLGVAMAVSGLVLFRNVHPDLHVKAPHPPRGTWGKLLVATSSIWVIVLVWVIVQNAVMPHLQPHLPPALARVAKYIALGTGLVASIVWTMRLNRMGPREAGKVFVSKSVLKLVAVIVSVMVFEHMWRRVEAAALIAGELQDLHVPIMLVVMALPFIAGLVTGLAIGFVGTSFPIVLNLVVASGDGDEMRAYVALAYAFGHLGQMMSPLHVCYFVSNEHFGTRFAPVYRLIAPAAVLTGALACGYFALLKFLL